MDLLASRLVGGAKSEARSKKNVKRLSKNDSKNGKKVSAFKVEPICIEASSKKQKSKKSLTNISSKKKELIKSTLIEEDSKLKSLSKNVKNVFKKKNKLLIEDPVKRLKKADAKLEKNTKNVPKKGKQILKPVNLVPVSEPKTDKKSKETSKVKKSRDKSTIAAFIADSVKENFKSETELKKPIIKSEKLVKVDLADLKSKKRKIAINAVEKSCNNAKLLKKIEAEPSKLVELADNVEIKSIKSKKRKELNTTKVKESSTADSTFTKKEIKKLVVALFKVAESDEQMKKTLFTTDKPPIFLQVTCIKVPKTPLHQMRFTLPHSMVSATDDVALLVKDLKRGRRRDCEETVQHYEDLLSRLGITSIKTIIPINQIKTEYRQFELRRKLLGTYDYFLVDGRISGHMAHLLGKQFRVKRKLPTSIHMDSKNLKAEINTALKKTSLQIHSSGDSSTVQVGTFSMDIDKIVNNILSVVNDLRKNYPGGWENIRSLRIKTPLSFSIPIYLTLKKRDEVEVPVLMPKRPKAYETVEGELSTFTSNVKVSVAPDGTVNVQKLNNNSDDEENADEDDESDEDEEVGDSVKVKKESEYENDKVQDQEESNSEEEDVDEDEDVDEEEDEEDVDEER